MMGPLAAGVLALCSAGSPATALQSEDSQPMLVHWTLPFAGGREAEAHGLIRRMESHLDANYPNAGHRRVFESPFAGAGVLHWFAGFESVTARLRFERALRADGAWQSMLAEARASENERIPYLFQLGGAAHENMRLPYRWLRVTRARPSGVHAARVLAADIAEHLEETYTELDARAFSADLHDRQAIYLLVDYGDLTSWEQVRGKMLADPDYLELMNAASDLFLDEDIEETMLLETLFAKNADDYLSLAVSSKQQGDPDRAVAAYRLAIEADPELAAAHHNLGHVLQDEGDYVGAAAAFRRWSELQPEIPKAHTDLARALDRSDDIDGAIASYRAALALDPEHVHAHTSLAYELTRKGELEAAAAHCIEALALNPGYARAHSNLGAVCAAQGDLDAATRHYLDAIEADPKYALARLNLASLHQSRGDVEDALRLLRDTVRVLHSSAEARNQLAWLLVTTEREELRDADEALRHSKRATELVEDEAAYWGTYGGALYRAGHFRESDEALRRSVRLSDRGYPEDGYLLAMVHHELGNEAEALRWYDDAARWEAELGEENADAVARLRAEAEARLGRP